MAIDKKISDLPAAVLPVTGSIVEILQGGVNVQANVNDLASAPVTVYADQTALLANSDMIVGYLAYVIDTGTLYIYRGPSRNNINNYTIIVTIGL